ALSMKGSCSAVSGRTGAFLLFPNHVQAFGHAKQKSHPYRKRSRGPASDSFSLLPIMTLAVCA
ncbi:hypothetical protein, partial [Brevibacillus parabrevis]|uniref:hypothetical protein n=1 Tax=Brevibacillus parabrevis TaxID=54914 RepID=UPI001C3FBBE4